MLVTGYWGEVVDPGKRTFLGSRCCLLCLLFMKYGLVKLLLKLPWKKLQQIMLVRTCRMGNLPLGLHDGTGWIYNRNNPAGNIDVAL
jgi:hypothetical protein